MTPQKIVPNYLHVFEKMRRNLYLHIFRHYKLLKNTTTPIVTRYKSRWIKSKFDVKILRPNFDFFGIFKFFCKVHLIIFPMILPQVCLMSLDIKAGTLKNWYIKMFKFPLYPIVHWTSPKIFSLFRQRQEKRIGIWVTTIRTTSSRS